MIDQDGFRDRGLGYLEKSRLAEVGGRLVHHSRKIILKVAMTADKYGLYLEIISRTYELLLQQETSAPRVIRQNRRDGEVFPVGAFFETPGLSRPRKDGD